MTLGLHGWLFRAVSGDNSRGGVLPFTPVEGSAVRPNVPLLHQMLVVWFSVENARSRLSWFSFFGVLAGICTNLLLKFPFLELH